MSGPPRPKQVTAPVSDSPPWSTDQDYREARQIVGRRCRGMCEAGTPECRGVATQVHHKAGRGFDGCHHPDLLLAVCGSGNWDGCHGYIHAKRKRAESAGWLLPHGTTAGTTEWTLRGTEIAPEWPEKASDLLGKQDKSRDISRDIPDPF